jgi:tetratricopeptide (TPR) repeat protein
MKRMFVVIGSILLSVAAAAMLLWLRGERPTKQKINNDLSLLIRKNSIEEDGRRLEDIGNLNGALKKYEEAIALDLKIYGSDLGRPMAFKAKIFQRQERYKEAQEIVTQLLTAHPGQENYLEWIVELGALIQYKSSHDPTPVYNYINHYRQKYFKELPPNGYSARTSILVTGILALYDTIGDLDSGIKYMDEIIDFSNKRNPDRLPASTSDEAIKMSLPINGAPNPNRRRYEVDAEYLKVREAFQKDKAEGKKGRATQALIQSKHFTW